MEGLVLNTTKIEQMFQEIERIYQTYQLPKMMGFIPDHLEIEVTRHDREVELRYREGFHYLPDHALEVARENAIQFMQQLGFPTEAVVHTTHGVQVQLRGDSPILQFLLLELLLQIARDEPGVKAQLDALYRLFQIYARLLDFHGHWNAQIEQQYNDQTTALHTITQEHPSVLEEIAAIIEKYGSNAHNGSEPNSGK